MTWMDSLAIRRRANQFRLLGHGVFVNNQWNVNEGEPKIDLGHGIGDMGLP